MRSITLITHNDLRTRLFAGSPDRYPSVPPLLAVRFCNGTNYSMAFAGSSE